MLPNNLPPRYCLSLGLNEPQERIIRVICSVLDAVIKCGGPNDPKMRGSMIVLLLHLLTGSKDAKLNEK